MLPLPDLPSATPLDTELTGSDKYLKTKEYIGIELPRNGNSIQVPRTVKRQTGRENHPAASPEAYYRSSVYIPLLNDLLAQMGTRFYAQTQKAIHLSKLVPGLPEFSDCSDRFFHEALEVYRSLSPHFSAEGAAGELSYWRALWAHTLREKYTRSNFSMSNCPPYFNSFYTGVKTVLTWKFEE